MTIMLLSGRYTLKHVFTFFLTFWNIRLLKHYMLQYTCHSVQYYFLWNHIKEGSKYIYWYTSYIYHQTRTILIRYVINTGFQTQTCVCTSLYIHTGLCEHVGKELPCDVMIITRSTRATPSFIGPRRSWNTVDD